MLGLVARIVWIVSACAGVVLIIRGLRGVRVGNEERCARCGYILTGLPSRRCPECGSDFAPENVRIGTRKRRYGSAFVGLLLLMPGAIALTPFPASVDWYRYCPFRALLFMARHSDAQSMAEVVRRCETDALTRPQVRRLAKTCFAMQKLAFTAPEPEGLAWTNLLERLDRTGRLEPEESLTYYDQMVETITLDVPRLARTGDAMEARIYVSTATPTLAPPIVYFQVEKDVVRIDGAVNCRSFRCGAGGSEPCCAAVTEWSDAMSSAEHTITIPMSLQPGRHDFAYSAKLRLVRGRSTLEPWSRGIAFKRTVEVVPQDYPPTVTLCTDDAVGRRLHELLTVESRLTIERGHLANGDLDRCRYFGINIIAHESLPVSLASDVFLVKEDQEYRIGTLFALEGTTEVRVDMQRRLDFLEETDVVVSLRLNARQARGVSHDYTLWGKELVLGKVKVGRIAD